MSWTLLASRHPSRARFPDYILETAAVGEAEIDKPHELPSILIDRSDQLVASSDRLDHGGGYGRRLVRIGAGEGRLSSEQELRDIQLKYIEVGKSVLPARLASRYQMAVIDDRELWACAVQLVRQHGVSAYFWAAHRAEELLDRRDLEGNRTFIRIAERIRQLEISSIDARRH